MSGIPATYCHLFILFLTSNYKPSTRSTVRRWKSAHVLSKSPRCVRLLHGFVAAGEGTAGPDGARQTGQTDRAGC